MLDTVLCSCGSGLRRLRCCDLDPAALPDAPGLDILSPMAVQATQLFNEKKHREAEALALKILDLAPNHRMALRVLFEIRKAENKAKAAEALARRLAGLPAENPAQGTAAQLQLAQLLVGAGRHRDAEPAARAALKFSPRDATAHHVMGVILTETGRLRAGETHYRGALAFLEREDGMVLANLAWNLKLQGRLPEAAAVYERALLIRPDNARGIGGFAQVEAARGNLPRATAMLDEALATWPKDRTLRLLRALMDLQSSQPAAVLARLSDAPETLLPAELSARGQAFSRLGRPGDAIASHALAKRMQRERYGQSYQPGPLTEQAARYKSFFTAERLLNLPRATLRQPVQPIFLLGFPRSGSALLEQFLSLVQGFAPADGAAPVSDFVDLIPRLAGLHANIDETTYPEALGESLIGDGRDIPEELRRRYHETLQNAGIITPSTRFVTDRADDNHWHLGLIKLLFPEAPVIHLIRHPYDLMLSNFAQDKKLEANCAVSLPALAAHYDLTMSLIRHYRGQLTLRYLPVRYEDLVTTPAATLSRVLDFIGADPANHPDEAILRENRHGQNPISPGHAIMQEHLHARGLYRHRADLALIPNLFQDVRPILDPWITELGYGDDP
jgi:tetratricopeptide (TPR) repeat protein